MNSRAIKQSNAKLLIGASTEKRAVRQAIGSKVQILFLALFARPIRVQMGMAMERGGL